jgi:septum formation protein
VSLQAAIPRLVLASASTARRSLLSAAGLQFEVVPAVVDEDAIKSAACAASATPDDTAVMLARMKAMRVSAHHPDAVVIGADQLLVCDGEWFDKPGDRESVHAQVLQLRGRRHTLVTAVTCIGNGTALWHHVARPCLLMRRFSDAVLDSYLASEAEQVIGCVGGYRVEAAGSQLFDAIDGDYFSILGLPLLPLLGFLRQHGVLMS